MGKNNKKSLLAGAVLASVLGCGFCVPSGAQAANVNAVVGPKDFGTLNGKVINFGQKRGYVENQTVTYPAGTPTWQIIAGDNGSISLLANQPWGYNRFSDTNTYDTLRNPGATVTVLYYEEALKYLNDHSKEFFSAEEIAFLQNQTVLEAWNQVRYMGEGECGEKKFTSIFALPTMEQVKVLEEEKRKRDFVYWLADGYTFVGDIDRNPEKYLQICDMRYDANTVQEGGSIVEKAGQNQNYIFPTIEPSLTTFAMYGDKTGYDNVFKIHNIEDTAPLRLTFKDTNKEKNINISNLSVAQEGITFDANGLATGDGQGIGGIVEDANGNYLAYARLADSVAADGTAKGVEIKFNDTSITGNNTIHLFNEWIGDKYDLAGNFIDVGVEMNSNKISELTYLPNVQELILGDGVKLPLSGDRNFKKLTIGNGEFTYTAVNIQGAGSGSFYYTESQAVKVTEALDWANVLQAQGEIILKGSFSVADDALTLVRPTNTDSKWKYGITGWNDITYNGQAGQSATLKVKGKMHGLVVNGGTFAAEQDLTLEEYLQVNNGAVANFCGNVTTNNVNLNGTLNMTTADKTFTVNKDFTAENGAKITGVDSTDKVVTGENLTAKGNIAFDKVTLEAAKNIQVQGNLDSNVNVSSNEINVRGNLSAERITSKNITAGGNVNVKEMNVNGALNFANGKAQNITVGALAFGESGKLAGYTFDVGKDIFTISNSASGKVKLSFKYGANLNNGDKVEVFNGGDLSGLTMNVARVTDTAGKKTYLMKQDASDRGKLNVIATKHNAAVNIGDDVKGQKVVFGNYWQENRNVKQPVLWSCVKHDGGQTVFLSDKILAETGGSVYDTQMWKITNFLKQDSGFVKELFTISEIVALSCVGEDALGLPSLEDVKDGGNYSWNADGRKAETTFYAGNGGRYYALGSTHSFDGVYINDWVDSSNGDIGTYRSLWFAFGDGSHYGIRPTISFDDATVLFATNAESAKGSTALGNFTRLKDVDENSTLELTFDDAYLAAKAGTERQTGDIRTDVNIVLQGSNLSLKYSNAKYMDENSYVSCLIGESNLPEDYFGYGKADRVNKLGSDTLSINMANLPTGAGDSGCALTFFNEYGNGTSFVGGMQVLPGSFRVDKGNLVYSIAPGDLTLDVQVGKGNILELTGTGVLAKKITGAGKVLVANNGISASGDQMVMDFETAEGVTMTITAGKVTGSLKGNFILQKENPTSTYTDVYFYGKSIEGHISSDKESNVFVLIKDAKVSGDLSIDHFKGRRGYTLADVYTLDMRQSGADTTSYNTLTIGKLHAGGKLAIDADLLNLQSDKIVLNGVDFEGNTITLSAVNITAAPETFEGIYTISNVATGSAKNAVVTKAGGLKVYTSQGQYTVTIENGNLKFDTGIAPAPVGLAEFIQSTEAGGSYSFTENQTLTGAVTTGNTDKGVFLNGNDLTGSHNEGITVAANHTLNIMGNGKISGFGTALKVEGTGVLNLGNITFASNATGDVDNNGTMNIHGRVTMETLTGSGTTTVVADGELNLGGAAAQEITQTFAGEGTLNFNGDTTIAVDKLGTAMNTIATGKGLNLTSGGDNTLTKPVSGGGTIAIDEGNTIQTNADNLQVAVVNYGKLKIGVDGPGRISKGIIGGGTLEFAQHTIVEGGDILQNGVTVDESVAVETGKIIVPTEITNKGALLINAGDLQGKAVNSTDGGTFIVNGYTMYNGAVYLYSDGTEAGRKLEGRIANGKTMVMDEVRTEWDKLENTEIYINGDAKLTLYRSATTAANIDMDIRGCKELDNGAGTGTLVTDGNFTADLDRVQVPLENTGTLALNAGTSIKDMGKMTNITNSGTLTIGTGILINGAISNSGTMAINTGEDFTGTISNVGTVDFNKDITLKGKIEGEGTYNNKAAMTVGDVALLNISELKNDSNATVQLGNHTEQTLNTVITGGTLKIVGDISTDTDKLGADKTDIAQNRTLILTAGTLTKKLEGAGNLTFATDMNINADNIATSGTNTLMEGKTLTFTAGTLAEKLGGGGNIVIGGDVSSTLGNLANTGTLTVNDNSILTLTGENTLTKNIAGAGTTKANGTLTVLTDQTIAGTLELGEGSALKLTDGSTGLNTLTAGTLKGTTNLYLGVDMLNNVADKVAAGVVAENTTINIQHINITREPAGSVSGEQTVKYLTENGTAPTHGSYTVNGAADGKILLSTTDYIYTFTNGDERGSIKYTVEALDVTLKEFLEGTKHEGSVDIGSFGLTGDNTYTETAANMGAPTQANRELTLYLNGHKVEKTAETATAMTVSTGDKRLNLDGGEEGSADLNFDVKEGGVLAVSGSTALTGNIMNAGEVAFDGIVTASGELTGAGKYTNSNCLIVADAAKLQMTEGLKNEGVLNLGGSAASELGTDIAGKGTINILGTLTSGKNIENKVVVAAGVMLSNTGTISGAVDNAGTMFTTANGITGGLTNNSPNFFLTGGDLGSDINGTGSISIIGNVTNSGGNLIAQYALSLLYGIALTTNADALVIDGDAGTISNSGRMTLTGGTLQEMVRGDTGSLTIEGDVVALNNITQRFLHINPGKSLDMAGDGKKLKIEEDIDNKGTLNIAAGDLMGNVVNNGTVNLTDGTLANQIEGEGSIVIEGAVSSTAANLGSIGTLTVNNGSVLELTAGELAKAITNSGTVKLNGVALGGKHITSGILEFAQDLTIAADYVAADTNKIDQGVTLTFTAGTLTKKLEGGGNLVFAGNVGTDVDNIAVAGTTVVNSGTLTLTDGVLVKKLEGAGNIAIGGEVETEWKNLANTGTLTVNDNSILALTGDVTLEKDIAGAGTTKVNGTMTVLTDQNIAGTLELGSGSTLKLTDGSTGLNTLTVGTLKGTTNLYLGVDMSTNTGDKVAAGVVAENAQINVQHINIVKDRAAGSGYPSGWQTVQYLTENGSTPTRGDYTLNGEEGKFILTTGGGNTYTFENGEAKGSIKYTVEALNVTLKDFFEGTKHEGSVDIGTFSLTGDNAYTGTAADMGAPTQANRELTLYLNGHKVEKTAETATAMTVSTGDKRLNLDGGEEGSADLNFDVKEGGVLAVSGSTALTGNIMNAGEVAFDGIVTASGELTGAGKYTNSNCLIVADAAKLQMTKGLKNGGILYLGNAVASGLGTDITGEGKTFIMGAVDGGTKTITQDYLCVNSGGALTVNGDNLRITDEIFVAGGTDAGGTIIDAGKLELTGGTLTTDIRNGGTVKTTGDVTIRSAIGGGNLGTLVVESGTLEYTNTAPGSISNNVVIRAGATMDPDAGVFSAGTTVTNYGTLKITGGTLTATIDGKGGDNLVMEGAMTIGGTGKVGQAAGSNIIVDAPMIEADSNDPARAMFKGIDNAGQLNVADGNLTLGGRIAEGKYYVLVAGTAVNGGTLTSANLWNMDNIAFSDGDILMADMEVVYNTNTSSTPGSVALYVSRATTDEEANTSGLAAVQQGNITVAREFTAEVENHLGMLAKPEGQEKYEKEIWASHVRTKETTEEMQLGAGLEAGNTAQYNGTVVGADFYSSKKAVAGVALSYTTGDIDSNSHNTFTRNKSKYYGVSLYDRVTNGSTALIYDIGYIRGDNEIEQFYNGMETEADAKTDTYTAGVRWEAALKAGRGRVVPFAALRYMRQNNRDYTNSRNTGFETKNQNLYIPKVGIAWTGEFQMPKSVWTWRPAVEVGYVWNLGERNAESKIFAGTNCTGIEYDTLDRGSYYAKLGMEFGSRNFTAGLFYRYLKGDAVRNNRWNINVNFSF